MESRAAEKAGWVSELLPRSASESLLARESALAIESLLASIEESGFATSLGGGAPPASTLRPPRVCAETKTMLHRNTASRVEISLCIWLLRKSCRINY